jgi:hypothetical protein
MLSYSLELWKDIVKWRVVDFKLTSQGANFPKEKRTPREGEKQFRGKIMYKVTDCSQKKKEEQFLDTQVHL